MSEDINWLKEAGDFRCNEDYRDDPEYHKEMYEFYNSPDLGEIL